MTETRLDIASVVRIVPDDLRKHVPPLSDYLNPSQGWTEAEYRWIDMQASRAMGGFWTGEPGSVEIDPWPYTEVCSILSGRVAVVDHRGQSLEFGAGTAFVIPRGFAGKWVTLESATKIFLAIS